MGDEEHAHSVREAFLNTAISLQLLRTAHILFRHLKTASGQLTIAESALTTGDAAMSCERVSTPASFHLLPFLRDLHDIAMESHPRKEDKRGGMRS